MNRRHRACTLGTLAATALALVLASSGVACGTGAPADVRGDQIGTEGEGEGDVGGEGEGDAVVPDDDDSAENPGDPVDPGDPGDPLDPLDCPAGVICVGALPFTATGDTHDGADVFDAYSCGAQNESGPELVYRVAVPGPGVFSVALDESLEANGTDVDVQILSSEDPQACLARNDHAAVVPVAAAGFVWVVLDSFVRSDGTNGAGAFSAAFTFTEAPVDGGDPLVAAGVPADVAALAMRAYASAFAQGLTDSTVFTVVDYALPSYQERLWTVDLATGAVLIHDRVSHGSGSNSPTDPAMATTFSNTPGSNQSSLGLVRTAETYDGHNGYSLRLDGLEPSNDNMRDRAVVMHGAAYSEDSFVDDNGYLGRSNGCLAVAMSRSASIIDVVKEGTLIFDYYPDAAWIASSPFLQ